MKTRHRTHVAHLEWLDLQWNEPDRGDHYLMQLAALWTKDRKTNEMKIEFKTVEERRESSAKMTRDEIHRQQAAVLLSFGGAGFAINRTGKPPDMRNTKKYLEETTPNG